MEERTFEGLSEDQIRSMTRSDHEDQLANLQVLILDDEGPLSRVMPYFADFRAYGKHVADCEPCSSGPVWELGCPHGADLAHQASKAMSAQDALAELN